MGVSWLGWGLDKILGWGGVRSLGHGCCSFAPSGLVGSELFHPRLAPWAAFLRRFAAERPLRFAQGLTARNDRIKE